MENFESIVVAVLAMDTKGSCSMGQSKQERKGDSNLTVAKAEGEANKMQNYTDYNLYSTVY